MKFTHAYKLTILTVPTNKETKTLLVYETHFIETNIKNETDGACVISFI